MEVATPCNANHSVVIPDRLFVFCSKTVLYKYISETACHIIVYTIILFAYICMCMRSCTLGPVLKGDIN